MRVYADSSFLVSCYIPDANTPEAKAYLDGHTVQLFLDHVNIPTSSRYLKPPKLALHTTIQRIDEQRRQSSEAEKWEQELVEPQKNLRPSLQNC
jgi:hypothetical protein